MNAYFSKFIIKMPLNNNLKILITHNDLSTSLLSKFFKNIKPRKFFNLRGLSFEIRSKNRKFYLFTFAAWLLPDPFWMPGVPE